MAVLLLRTLPALVTGTGLAALAFAVAGLLWLPHGERPKAAPEVMFHTIEGETLPLSSFRGNPVWVGFWATDCLSCRQEIPYLKALQQQYGPKGLAMIAVAMWYDPPSQVIAVAESEALPYRVALDPRGAVASAFQDVRLVPAHFLIDPAGRIVRRQFGDPDFASWEAAIQKMLRMR